MNAFPYLTVLTMLPLACAVMILGLGDEQKRYIRPLAIVASLVGLAATILIWLRFDAAQGGMQLVERAAWVESLGIEYHLGVDGLGLVMLLLSALIIPFALVTTSGFERSSKLYAVLMLLTEAALFGVFTAQNFFHWFLFWELSLIPAFFLIKMRGGAPRRRAAFQFLVFTLVGSVTMLLAFVAIYAATGIFDFGQLADLGRSGELSSALFAKLGGGIFKSKRILETLIFLGVFLGFAVKVPLIPFHTWLPSAYAEAPTGTSMVLSGAMSKMGVYGFLRILLPIFPEQMRAFLTPLLWLAVATIIFSAAAAFAQKDLKRIVAYSSISQVTWAIACWEFSLRPASPARGWRGALKNVRRSME
jgi:NADH-quinone oxidoreductase subunit M